MNARRSSHGYALELTAVACMGALACGPGNAANDGDETTGYPIDTGTDEAPETESETDTETGEPDSSCSYRGSICGEMSVCQCDCDYSEDCCSCAPAECTDDSHCGEGQGCAQVLADIDYAEYRCVPDYCESVLTTVWLSGMPSPVLVEGVVCLHRLDLSSNEWADLAPLASLRYVDELIISDTTVLADLDGLAALEQVGNVQIFANPALNSIGGLAGLQGIGGGAIHDNPMLATADVLALLAQIPGGDTVVVCGNLDGEAC